MGISELWWPGYDLGLRLQPDRDGGRGLTYFLFVEDAEEMEWSEVLDGPDGFDLKLDHPVLEEPRTRFRTCGFPAWDFLRRMDDFEELTAADASPEQRQARRTALLSFFEEVPVPIVDIYVGQTDDELRAMRLTLVPGSWQVALIDFDQGGRQPPRPVYASGGAMVERPDVGRGGLVRLAPVPPPIELRLRDIFSLNHVPDGEVDPEEGDDSTPFDKPRPGTRPSGGGEAETWETYAAVGRERVFEEEGEEEEGAAVQTYSRESHYPARAKRSLVQTQGGGG